MKHKRLFGLFILPVFLLASCAADPEDPDEPPYSTDTNVVYESIFNPGKTYTFSAKYDDNFFLQDAKNYSKELALLSYSSAVASDIKEVGEHFFTTAKFKDLISYDYDKDPTPDTLGYMIAHKKILNNELFAVSIRGLRYGAEWSNNFLVGSEGNHQGFSMRASDVFRRLEEYIGAHNNGRTIKIWISGYSRAGAVSNVVSSMILKGTQIEVSQSNLFTYTFEAPNCLTGEDIVAYPNVHNIRNRCDLVPSIPPASFGFGLCGVEHQIYDENVSKICKEFDEDLEVPEYVPIEIDGYGVLENDEQLLQFVSDCVFNNPDPSEDLKPYTCNNREEYVERYQNGFSHILGYLFSLSSETLGKMMEDIQELGFAAIFLLSDGTTLANFLKTYLDQDQIPYDVTGIDSDCQAVRDAVMNLFLYPITFFVNPDYRPSLIRIIDMHFPEVTYALLLNSFEQAE